MMKKDWKTKIIYVLIFGFILVLNFLTPYVADDYVYMVSFDTKELLTSLSQIPGSMYVHCLKMNGRLISHTMEQLFMLVPKGVFNLCNAFVFTLLIRLTVSLSNQNNAGKPLCPAAAFMALWCATPVFGQVFLWQVGALNYLWALAGCLLFISPYLRWYYQGTAPDWRWMKTALVCLGSVLFGMYSEMTSFVGIYLACALLVLTQLLKKRKARLSLLLPVLFAIAGYGILLSIPAEVTAKVSGGLTPSVLLLNAIRAVVTLIRGCWHLLLIWGILFLYSILQKKRRDGLVLSFLMFTGAAGSACMTIIASYFPQRCLSTASLLLILGIAFLLNDALPRKWLTIGTLLLAGIFIRACWIGTKDIVNCHLQFSHREAAITQAKTEGTQDLVLDIVIPETPYSPFWDLRDLSCDETETWPNSSMAKYYGVDSILGKPDK